MTREEAFKIVEENLGNKNLIKHSLAVEAVMKAFGEYFNENSEKWALAGLLHDIDYEQTANDPQSHTLITAKILEEKEVDKEIIDIIKAIIICLISQETVKHENLSSQLILLPD